MPNCNNLAQSVYMTYNVINSRIIESDSYENNTEIIEYNPDDYDNKIDFDELLHTFMPSLSLIRSYDNQVIYMNCKHYLKIIFEDDKIIIKVYETMKDAFNN